MFNNIYKGKKVLVTGHTGFKGSWLTCWLLKMGAEVAGYSIGIPTHPSHFEELELEQKIQHKLGDIRDYDTFKTFCDDFKPEFIFHLAAQPLVRESYETPKETFEVNMLGTLNVLEAIRLADYVKVGVIITSDKCYDNVEWVHGYRENDRLGGADPYSGSKGAAELIASSYMRSFFTKSYPHIATTRAGNVIGGGDWAKDRIIPDIVKNWSGNKSVTVRNPNSTRPWQHVMEPLSGYLALGAALYEENSKVANEAFNFGPESKVNKTVRELLEQMIKEWKDAPGWTDESGTVKTTQHEYNLLKLSCDKANIILNWYPALSFEETINLTAEWYKIFYAKTENVYSLTERQIEFYSQRAAALGITWAQQ
jgi:CDP-glucose 4,6-dehydratase